ncbi:hypothetical protein QE152_g30629 [Popillia japonica]|uniref:MULE transposase domain-containing protein n=1 Tax=Popillia japonica TaxID=7064 RepID=A0AAW1JDU4_POPJA
MTCIPKVYEEEFHQIKDSGLEFVTKMPAYESIKSSLYRHRNKALGVPALPKTRAEFIVPDYINKTEDGENFTIFDQGIKGLSSKNTIFGDGTFKCCNSLFDQLYTFHVDLKSTEETTSVRRPALYALLPNRKKDTYIKLLTLMKEHIPNFNPRSMKIDFESMKIDIETSTILACREMFPDCKLKGCNFHFNQSIWRKVQELGLAKRYREDKDIRKHIKLTAALAHLPPQYIDDGWLYIMESSPNFREIMDFNDYFVTQWLENTIVIIKFNNDATLSSSPERSGDMINQLEYVLQHLDRTIWVFKTYVQTVTAARNIGGYDHEKKTFKAPSLAMHLGTSLKPACEELTHLVLRESTGFKWDHTDNGHNCKDFENALTEAERVLITKYKRVVNSGKESRAVVILIPTLLQNFRDLLLKYRLNVIPSDNEYVFAVPGTIKSGKGDVAIKTLRKKIELQNPNAISSNKLRKHIATVMQILNLTQDEAKQFANFMGHAEKTQWEVYE